MGVAVRKRRDILPWKIINPKDGYGLVLVPYYIGINCVTVE